MVSLVGGFGTWPNPIILVQYGFGLGSVQFDIIQNSPRKSPPSRSSSETVLPNSDKPGICIWQLLSFQILWIIRFLFGTPTTRQQTPWVYGQILQWPRWWQVNGHCLQKGPYFTDLVLNNDLFGILGPYLYFRVLIFTILVSFTQRMSIQSACIRIENV